MNGLGTVSSKVVMNNSSWSVNYDAGIYAYRDIARLLAHATFGSSRDEIIRGLRLGLPLASKDPDLCDAAERLGVSLLRAA